MSGGESAASCGGVVNELQTLRPAGEWECHLRGAVMSVLLEVIAQPLFELAGYFAGRALLPAVTLGRVRGIRLVETVPFRWHGFKRLPDGTIVVHDDVACLIGIFFIVGCVIVACLIYGSADPAPMC
jgi:hypothetical protein